MELSLPSFQYRFMAAGGHADDTRVCEGVTKQSLHHRTALGEECSDKYCEKGSGNAQLKHNRALVSSQFTPLHPKSSVGDCAKALPD